MTNWTEREIEGVSVHVADGLSREDEERLRWIIRNAEAAAVKFAEERRRNVIVGRKPGAIYWWHRPDQMRAAWQLPFEKADGSELTGWYTGNPNWIINVGWTGDWKVLWHEYGHHFFGGEEVDGMVVEWSEWALEYEHDHRKQ